MPLDAAWLPVATPFDPAEEPPGSLDPLGTAAHAERLAEVLLPGFTVRMWRARLLTFAVVAAAVADRAVALMGNREDVRLEARLAVERLFVSAVVRMSEADPTAFGNSPRRLPGRELAKRALVNREPLTRANFLKGQAVNGPFGVIARLARDVKLIDADGRIDGQAVGLLMAWSQDERLFGVLDEDNGTKRDGSVWMTEIVKGTVACVGSRDWPSATNRIWELLAKHLRPDQIGERERKTLLCLLETSPVRRRVMELLTERFEVYSLAVKRTADRGEQEPTVLQHGLRPELGSDPTDRLIKAVIEAIHAYEQTSALLQQAFDGLIWALKARGGRARPDTILEDTRLRRHLEHTRNGLLRVATALRGSAECLRGEPAIDPTNLIEPILRLHEDVVAASASVPSLADTILRRHERIQKDKRKAPWIERESYWTLMPGENHVDATEPPVWQKTYLHPFKIPNAYAMLGDLRCVAIEVQDAEE